MPVGFWEMMFDSDYRRRSDINDAMAMDQQLAIDIGSLSTQVGRMAENLRQLSVTVGVLVEMLAEAKQLDPAEVRRRAEARVAELMPRRPPPAPAEVHPQPPPLNTQPLICIKCGRSVPANLTLMTENGPCCDPGCP